MSVSASFTGVTIKQSVLMGGDEAQEQHSQMLTEREIAFMVCYQ